MAAILEPEPEIKMTMLRMLAFMLGSVLTLGQNRRMNTPILTPLQARVLATLMEKARTVTDTYPLTLNGVVAGCNQKTSRDPVISVTDQEVLDSLEGLRELGLVREVSTQRAMRYEHQFQRFYGVPEQSAVLLGLLCLRGAQTAAELRANAERCTGLPTSRRLKRF